MIKGNGRAGVLCGYRTGDGEKAGTYNDAYTQGYEAEGAQHAAQAALAFVAGFMQQLRQWFSDKNSHSFFLFFRVTRIGYKKRGIVVSDYSAPQFWLFHPDSNRD